MCPPQPLSRRGDLGTLIDLANKFDAATTCARSLAAPPADAVQRKRRLIADLCRLLGAELKNPGSVRSPGGPERDGGPRASSAAAVIPGLSPRLGQTLDRLLAGDSEKQVAARLGLSRHTIHVYVKGLYRHFDVCTRGELLARFVRPAETALRADTAAAPQGPGPV